MIFFYEGDRSSSTSSELTLNTPGSTPNPVPHVTGNNAHATRAINTIGLNLPDGRRFGPSAEYPSGGKFFQNTDAGAFIIGGKDH